MDLEDDLLTLKETMIAERAEARNEKAKLRSQIVSCSQLPSPNSLVAIVWFSAIRCFIMNIEQNSLLPGVTLVILATLQFMNKNFAKSCLTAPYYCRMRQRQRRQRKIKRMRMIKPNLMFF